MLYAHIWLFVTPWTAALQTPQSMGFPRQEYQSGLPFPSPGDLPNHDEALYERSLITQLTMNLEEEMKSAIKISQNPEASWKPLRSHSMKGAQFSETFTLQLPIKAAPELIYTVKDRILTIHVCMYALKVNWKWKLQLE